MGRSNIKAIFKRKLALPIALCAAVVVLGGALGLRAGLASPTAAAREIPIYCVDRDDKVLSISFDAAWGDEDTDEILSALSEAGVKATFFLVGEWVDKYPHRVKQIFEAGHEIQNHSATHPHMPKIGRDKMLSELNICSDKIEAVTGVRPILFRPPYGDYSNDVIEVARGTGLYTIQWDVDSLDWKDLTAGQIYDRVVPKVGPGSIVLFHNGGKHTAESLPAILSELKSQGYTFLTISELIYKDNYTVDHTGRQLPRTGENAG
ncbi:MAG: polysaccharide deacetylase family protein [Clostridia bacterium]|nr:polysaccharide deacetylase family protein [Clostridia bacterium]